MAENGDAKSPSRLIVCIVFIKAKPGLQSRKSARSM